ncbi:hypothetical protein B0T26DRAFT_642576 [Lasiosphaeria miniovina]|uniref:Uncharacterized protein n=1 Tax=Lasiosphaeria miniovina TaxID=1954250 RepID=A0AA40E305_9PEZI|nr:uncharacterized protein B0T26DRAFT_642576 [Lasiosphaeria miniovina]KAK0723112.1 hypothetical protein B0T26DRAFT_642576 [Lasiosphaeria miniovina]
MAYIIYSLTFITIVFGTLLYLTRVRWLLRMQEALARIDLPGREYLYSQLPTIGGGSSASRGGDSFSGDMEAGLSSSTFDLSGNVADGDGRAGLDDAAKREILTIMKKRRLRFDEARRVYMEQRFKANGIGADGRPKDPKFVSFS